MKILLAGSGKVGETLVKQLSAEGYELTVIDSDAMVLDSIAERYDVIGMLGNCASMDTLLQADAAHADLMIAATGSDEVNLLCSMTIHGMNPHIHTIARIRNPEYIEQAYHMRDVFGLSLVFNPERQAAIEIERLLKYPGFLKRDSFAKGRVEIVELRIDEESPLCDVSLIDLYHIIKCRVLVCAVLRDGEAFMPDGHFTLRKDDKIFVTASSNDLSLLLKNLGIVKHKVRRVIIAGGSSTGYYLAEQLLENHIHVTIIEKKRERCLKLAELLPDANIICGDASNLSLLEKEGLSNADALISLTGMDEMNAVISMYGSQCEIPQIITKLNHMEETQIIDRLPVGSVICPRKLCCNTIVQYVRAMQNQAGAAITIHSIANGQAEAMEFLVDDTTLHCSEPLKNLKLKKNILIVCITRHGTIEIPSGNSSFQKGDSVVVVTGRDDIILQLNDIFA